MTGRPKHSKSNSQSKQSINQSKQSIFQASNFELPQSTSQSNNASDKPATIESANQKWTQSSDTSKKDGLEQKDSPSLTSQSVNQSINQWTNRSANTTITKSISQAANQPTNQPTNQTTNQTTSQSPSQSASQSAIQSANLSTNQSTNQSAKPSGWGAGPSLAARLAAKPATTFAAGQSPKPAISLSNKSSLKQPIQPVGRQSVSQSASQSRKQSLTQASQSRKQSLTQASQSRKQSLVQSPAELFPVLTASPVSRPINQSINQTIARTVPVWPARASISSPHQPAKVSATQQTSQSAQHSRTPSVNPSIHPSVSHSINQSIHQSLVRNSSSESTESNPSTPQLGPYDPNHQSTSQSINQPINLSNKQRKKAQRQQQSESVNRLIAELEENQRLEVEALQSVFLSDLQLLNSVPSRSIALTSVPALLRVTVLPEPMLDREKDNHAVIVVDIQYADISQAIDACASQSTNQSITSVDQIVIPPPKVTAYNVKGLSSNQMSELNQLIDSELKNRNDGNMLSLLLTIQDWLRNHNNENASFYEQMKKRHQLIEQNRLIDLKQKEVNQRLMDEEKRKQLAREVHEANKRKQQLAWKEEKGKKLSISQSMNLVGSPSFGPRLAVDSPLLRPTNQSINQPMNHLMQKPLKSSQLSASAPSSPLPSQKSNQSGHQSINQPIKKSKKAEKQASNDRAIARKQKEQRQCDELYRSISVPIKNSSSDDESSDEAIDGSNDESSDQSVDQSVSSSDDESSEDIEDLFPSPLMLGNGLSFFDQKRQNELALLAELDQGRVSSAKNTPTKKSRSLNQSINQSVNQSSDSSDESDDDDRKRVNNDKRRQSEASLTSPPPLPSVSQFSRYHNDFEVLQLLGRGGFGAVYKVRNRVDKLLYAVKVIRLKSNNQSVNQKLIREVSTIAMLHHSFICRYYASWLEAVDASQSVNQLVDGSADEDDDWFSSSYASHSQFNPASMIDDEVYDSSDSESTSQSRHSVSQTKSSINQYLYIQMEFYPNKTLKDFISDGSACQSPDLCWRLLRQMFEAVSYIHSKHIVHRDLKPANVFIDQNQNVKIGDFGLAVLMHDSGSQTSEEQFGNVDPSSQSANPSASQSITRSISQSISRIQQLDALTLMSRESSIREVVGTVFYRSPEQETEGQKYDEKADIWALGVIAFELFHRFDSMSERAHVLSELRETSRVPADFMMKNQTNNQSSQPSQSGSQSTSQSPSQPTSQSTDRDRVIQLIQWLLSPSPNDRPSASEVLKSGLVPLKIEDEYLALSLKMLTDQKSVHYGELLESLFSGENDPLIDWTFDYLSQAQSSAMSYQLSFGQMKQSTPLPLASLQMFQQRVFDSVSRVFQLHGATHFATPLIHPKTQNSAIEGKTNQVVLLDSAGILVKLPYSLTVPFARFVAQSAASSLDPSRFDDRSNRASRWVRNSLLVGGESVPMDWRRHDIAKVYRRNPAGGRPREVFECDFDVVWPDCIVSRSSSVSPAMTSSSDRSPVNDIKRDGESYEYDKRVSVVAECISITLDALSSYHYAIGPVLVCINHLSLIELVINRMVASVSTKSANQSINRSTNPSTSQSTNLSDDVLRAGLYRVASQYAVTSVPFHRSPMRKQMIAESIWSSKLIDWFGSCLSLRSGHLDAERLCERVKELLLFNQSVSQSVDTSVVECALAEITSVYECLKALGVAEYVVFNLGLVSKRELYGGSLTFQAFVHSHTAPNQSTSHHENTLLLEPIAVGGCYDRLLSAFAPPSSDSIMHGCGINLAIEKLVHSVISCHLRARSQTIFPPLSPFLLCSSLHMQQITAKKQKKMISSSPAIAPIFTSPTSSLVPPSIFPSIHPSINQSINQSSVLLFSPRHHLLRERLTLASLFWSSGVTCHFSYPFPLTLSALFAYMKLHCHRYLVLFRRRLWRDRGIVEMIDLSTIVNQRKWDKLVTGLKQAEQSINQSINQSSNETHRLVDGVDTVLASEALTWLRNRGALGNEQSVNQSVNQSITHQSLTHQSINQSHPEIHVQLIDPHGLIKKEQKASLISSVRRCVAPYTASQSISQSCFSIAIDLPLVSLRAFNTAYLTYQSNNQTINQSINHQSSNPSKRHNEEIPSALIDLLINSVSSAKHRQALMDVYCAIEKHEMTYCFLYSIPDRKCDILLCHKSD